MFQRDINGFKIVSVELALAENFRKSANNNERCLRFNQPRRDSLESLLTSYETKIEAQYQIRVWENSFEKNWL